MTASLIRYDAAITALAECRSVDEVKNWTDKAAAMQAYGRMAKDRTLEIDAAEIRIRAERRLGEMLAAQKEAGGLSRGAAGSGINQHTPKEVRSSVTTAAPTLADAGISKDLSARAQKLAAVPEQEFENEVGQWRDRVQAEGARVSARLEAAGERELAKETKPVPKVVEPDEPLRARIAELEAEVERLKDELDQVREGAQEAIDQVEAATAILESDEAKLIVSLKGQLRVVESQRDIYLNENGHLKREVRTLQRKLKVAQ